VASMSLVPDPVQNVLLLTWVAFLVNCFASVQDVAVDGMAIDVLPADERGRANSFMAFGQVAGYSVSGALCATMLITFGVPGAAVMLTAGLGIIFLWGVIVRERRGEKILPWTDGQASERSIELQADNWGSIARNLNRVLFLKVSILLIIVTFSWRVAAGFWLVSAPVIAVQELGYESTDYSYWTSTFGAIAALLGLLLGPVIDRIGAKHIFFLALIGLGITFLLTGLAVPFWSMAYFPLVVLCCESFFGQAIFISFIALHMTICWNKVSATQFAIYMAWSNLARSIGASIYGEIQPNLAFGQEFIIMGFIVLSGAFVLSFVRLDKHEEYLQELDGVVLEK
ncbi:MAG TPA: MFS transporter, partial [Pseudomonadales bacterium]|nr:MFS transporter [Pseudomonadales bacterium]